MYRIGLIIMLGLLSIISEKSENFFEGKVEYELTYVPIHKNATIKFLEDNYGVKEMFLYKEGFYRRITLNRKGDTIIDIIHDPIKQRLYGSDMYSGDTINTYSTHDNIMSSYFMKELKEVEVNGEKLFGVEINLNVKEEYAFDGYAKINTKYFFSKKYKINPENHKNQKDGFYDLVVKEYPYLVLKTIISDGYIKEQTKEFIKIESKEIDDDIFKVDPSKPLREI